MDLSSTERGMIFLLLKIMTKNVIYRTAQYPLFAQMATGEKSNKNGSAPVARLSTYMKTREALWRMIASYPKCMPVEDAVRRARIDFTKPRKEVVAL